MLAVIALLLLAGRVCLPNVVGLVMGALCKTPGKVLMIGGPGTQSTDNSSTFPKSCLGFLLVIC